MIKSTNDERGLFNFSDEFPLNYDIFPQKTERIFALLHDNFRNRMTVPAFTKTKELPHRSK